MKKSFLITRPNYDPLTNCLFYWCNFVIEEADRKKFKIVDLKSRKSNRKEKYFLLLSRSKSTQPLKDRVAELFIAPSNLVVISLIKGNTTGKSYKRSQKSVQKKLMFLLTSEASQEQRDVAPFLLANKNNQILLGDQEARI